MTLLLPGAAAGRRSCRRGRERRHHSSSSKDYLLPRAAAAAAAVHAEEEEAEETQEQQQQQPTTELSVMLGDGAAGSRERWKCLSAKSRETAHGVSSKRKEETESSSRETALRAGGGEEEEKQQVARSSLASAAQKRNRTQSSAACVISSSSSSSSLAPLEICSRGSQSASLLLHLAEGDRKRRRGDTLRDCMQRRSTVSEREGEEEEKTDALSAGRMLLLSYLCYAVLYSTRKPFSVLKDAVHVSLGLSTYSLGCIDTAFLAAYAVGQFLLTPLLAPLALRTSLSACYVTSAVATLIFGCCSSATALITAWCGNGLAHAAVFPLLVKALSQILPRAERGRTMGLWTTSQQVGVSPLTPQHSLQLSLCNSFSASCME